MNLDLSPRLGERGRSPSAASIRLSALICQFSMSYSRVELMPPILSAIALMLPLLLAVILQNKVRALIYGTVTFWVCIIIGTQHNLSSDPNYQSVAPGISIVSGWLPGVGYSMICILLVSGIKLLQQRFRMDSK